MRSLLAFTKKEITEHMRSGKILFLGILFVLFGIMNPAVAKLTPWLMEMLADSLAESGMTITEVNITAMDSWVQFFKNIPMALIAFVLLESNIFTKEYRSGTLILSLTKGLQRYKVMTAKTAVLILLWSVGYWLCYGITYAYNAYFWDNAIAKSLPFSVLCWWVFGLWVIALMSLFSALFSTNTCVLVGTGGVVMVSALLSMIPKLTEYLPTLLTDGNSLIYGVKEPDAYIAALAVVGSTALAALVGGLILFNKKQL
ncbi:MAG: ABC transporter permease subunit [Clostridia bacterium]|nr:ABC transporter permease subunit [Clostridia bacterium]